MCLVDTSAQSIENEVINTIMARRSVRKYLDKPVEHAKLEAVVRCGINAPSGMNRQPWVIRVVENQEIITSVTEVFKAKNPDMVSRDPNFKNMFRNAPNIICICTPAKGGPASTALLSSTRLKSLKSASALTHTKKSTST